MISKAMQAALAAIMVWTIGVAAHARPHQGMAGIEHAQLLGTLDLHGKLFHVQGVDLDSEHIWVTSVDIWKHRGYLHEFDRATGNLVRQMDLTDGPRYHPGGFSITNRSIWVPVAEYQSKSSAVLEEIDIDSLQIRRKIRINDHIGCVAASGSTLIAGNWDSRRLYLIDLRALGTMQVVRNPSATRYQDMKLVDGQLVAGGVLTRHSGTIDWIDTPSMKLVRTLRTGAADRIAHVSHVRLLTNEGMALQGRELYVLPEDGRSRLFHFRLDDSLDDGRNTRATVAAL